MELLCKCLEIIFKPYLIASIRFWEKGNVVSLSVCLQKLHLKKCCSFSSVARNIKLAANRVQGDAVHSVADCSFSRCEEIATSKQQLFVCAETSVDKLTPRIQQHSCQCQRPLQRTLPCSPFSVTTVTSCCGPYYPIWEPSTWLTAEWVTRLFYFRHFALSVPACVRSCWHRKTATDAFLSEFFENYKECVKTLADESCVDALYEEIVSCPEMDGINILTDDARHGTRRNSKYTDTVVCIGAESYTECYVSKPSQELMCLVLRSMNC